MRGFLEINFRVIIIFASRAQISFIHRTDHVQQQQTNTSIFCFVLKNVARCHTIIQILCLTADSCVCWCVCVHSIQHATNEIEWMNQRTNVSRSKIVCKVFKSNGNVCIRSHHLFHILSLLVFDLVLCLLSF